MRWRFATLVEGVKLGRPICLDGLLINPVEGADAARAPHPALDALLQRLEWPSRLASPSTDLIPHILCVGEQEGPGETPDTELQRFLDRYVAGLTRSLTALAVLRGGAPRLLLTVAEREATPGSWQPAGLADHRRPYEGNLLVGPMSGEEPTLIEQYARAAADPRLSLWFGLAREASAESTSEGKVFRYAQLLEIISQATAPQPSPLIEEDGRHFAWADGSTRGVGRSVQLRVFRLLTRAARERELHLPSLFPPGIGDPWFGVRCLILVRDAVAHHGGLDLAAPQQQAQAWYDDACCFMRVVREAEPLLDPRDHLAQSARELARLVLSRHVVR